MGWYLGLVYGLVYGRAFAGLVIGIPTGLVYGLVLGLVLALTSGWPFKRSAVSSRLTLVWPSTRQQLLDFVRRAVRGLVFVLVYGKVLGLAKEWVYGLVYPWSGFGMVFGLPFGLREELVFGLIFGFVLALGFGLLQTRFVLITSRTPKEAHSRSLIAALTWLVLGLGFGLIIRLIFGMVFMLLYGLVFGLVFGLALAPSNGGWFVLLQRVAHRRLARAGNLPSPPYSFLEWGVEQQIFRRVGGGVRFRHNLIQQHLAKGSEGTSEG